MERLERVEQLRPDPFPEGENPVRAFSCPGTNNRHPSRPAGNNPATSSPTSRQQSKPTSPGRPCPHCSLSREPLRCRRTTQRPRQASPACRGCFFVGRTAAAGPKRACRRSLKTAAKPVAAAVVLETRDAVGPAVYRCTRTSVWCGTKVVTPQRTSPLASPILYPKSRPKPQGGNKKGRRGSTLPALKLDSYPPVSTTMLESASAVASRSNPPRCRLPWRAGRCCRARGRPPPGRPGSRRPP